MLIASDDAVTTSEKLNHATMEPLTKLISDMTQRDVAVASYDVTTISKGLQ